jgi:diguanylate cyclase (GGDEF)-like protein
VPIFGERWLEFWRARSLRFWLILSSSLALAPLMIAAAVGYYLHQQTFEGPLAEIAREEHLVRAPLEQLPIALWEVVMPLTMLVADGEERHAERFRREAAEVHDVFEDLVEAVEQYPQMVGSIDEARKLWMIAATLGEAFVTASAEDRTPLALHAIERAIDRAARVLTQTHERVAADIAARQDAIQASTIRDEIIAFAVSLVFMTISLAAIDKSLGGSIDQLVEGAARVAQGDRTHTVRVTLPPELRKVATAFNIMTEHIAAQEKALSETARTDGLTGLFNRREFDRVLEEELRRSKRTKDSFSLVMIDVDYFKKFNDTYGHQGGDAALVSIAETLRGSLRDVDKAFRYGGEELAVILPGSDAAAAQTAAERLRIKIGSRAIELPGRTATVTVSMGVADATPADCTASSIVAAADACLYRSKAEGRNRVTGPA